MSENIEKLQLMYAAFGRGDIATILDNVSDDVDWGAETEATEVPWYSIRRGRAGVAEFFEILGREVEFKTFQPTAFIPNGDEVIVQVDYDYRLRKNGKGTPIGSMHKFRVRDGKVTSFRAYEDTAAVRNAWAE